MMRPLCFFEMFDRTGFDPHQVALPVVKAAGGVLHAHGNECSTGSSSVSNWTLAWAEDVLEHGHDCFDKGVRLRIDGPLIGLDKIERVLEAVRVYEVSPKPPLSVVEQFMNMHVPFHSSFPDEATRREMMKLSESFGVLRVYHNSLLMPFSMPTLPGTDAWGELDRFFSEQTGAGWDGPQPGGALVSLSEISGSFHAKGWDTYGLSRFFTVVPNVLFVPRSAVSFIGDVDPSAVEVSSTPSANVFETAKVLFKSSYYGLSLQSAYYRFGDALLAAAQLEGESVEVSAFQGGSPL